MGNRNQQTSHKWCHGMSKTFRMMAVLVSLIPAPHLFAQSSAAQSRVTQSMGQLPQLVPEIEAAGIQLTFDVTSVKPNRSTAEAYSRFPLGPGDAYVPGGFFSATNQPLIAYLRFAYKLSQIEMPGLPAWVYDDRFD